MLQLIQNYRTGEIELADVPVPNCSSNSILVKNISSLISIGTEKSIIDLGKKSLLGKAKARPDLVKRFLDKAKKEGFLKTFQEALGRLDNPTPLGYSSAGIVVEVGANIHKFSPGDRVACIGAGYASHAEYISVPEHLCCKIPDNVSFEEASFGMLGIIALHGVRCASLTFGENVAVIGLGLLGLLTVQILKAYGSKVVGFDIDANKVKLAQELGIDYAFNNLDEFKKAVEIFSNGFGADAVIITAATKSNEPINTAVEIARMKGKIVLVGVADIHPDRNEMWHKEVEIVVSKAGGPGIFDPFYELKGIDYPIGYVRWTENRNLEEFLRLISEKRVNVNKIITHKFKINDALKVYEDLLRNSSNYIGVILQYPESDVKNYKDDKTKYFHSSHPTKKDQINIGVIGAGLFGKALLLPALSKINDVQLDMLSTSSSANVYHTGKKYKFNRTTTNYYEVLESQNINTVVILTPHSQHKKMVIEALTNHKHVFVEKPLCINEQELHEIDELYKNLLSKNQAPYLMVGYNRRFSPHSQQVYLHLQKRINPIMIHYRVNAGFVPKSHWVHSEEEGRSRIVGEICHFVDMLIFLTGSNPTKIYAERVKGDDQSIINNDNINIMISFQDGSVGNIFYTASGDKAFSRERVEIYSEGKTIVIDDYKETTIYFNGKRKSYKTINQDMGYKNELEHFIDVIKGKSKPLLTYKEIYDSTLTIFKIEESISKGEPIVL